MDLTPELPTNLESINDWFHDGVILSHVKGRTPSVGIYAGITVGNNQGTLEIRQQGKWDAVKTLANDIPDEVELVDTDEISIYTFPKAALTILETPANVSEFDQQSDVVLHPHLKMLKILLGDDGYIEVFETGSPFDLALATTMRRAIST